MHEARPAPGDFTGYDYKELLLPAAQLSLYLDCYRQFGWLRDDNVPLLRGRHQTTLRLKRARHLRNKTELTRLERHFEACARDMAALEASKTTRASLWAMLMGVSGTAFMAGSTFAVVHEPPQILLCVLLAIPGILGWILPYFVYKSIVRRQTAAAACLIEEKYDEICAVCAKGKRLLL